MYCCCEDAVVLWLARRISDLKVGGSTPKPYHRVVSFTPHCLSPLRCKGTGVPLCKEVTNVVRDKNGRFLVVDTTIGKDEFCFVNIYAPNDQTQQIAFFRKMSDSIRECQTDRVLIGGDFNCPLSALDKFGGKDVQV